VSAPEVVAEARTLAAREIRAYAEDTTRHVEDFSALCSPLDGDRCDLVAALRVIADRIEAQT
jgi:hypothetical protein